MKKDLEEMRKQQQDIEIYFKTHPKKGDKDKQALVKINKHISKEIAQLLKDNYKEVLE